MKVVSYNTVGRFLEENSPILLEREAVSQLILFNALTNQHSETNADLFFGRVEDDLGQAVLLFANVRPYNLVIHAANSSGIPAAAQTLSDYIIHLGIEIKGINANETICNAFTAEYGIKIPGYGFQEKLAMDIMELKRLKEINLVKGKTRYANMAEMERIAEWIMEFNADALEETVLYEDQIPKAIKIIESKRLYVFEKPDGEIVSMAAAAKQLTHGICINYVYTPLKFRNKGYAAANMYYLSKEMLEKGNQFCSLFVDKKNPVSNQVYKKIGYEILEDHYDLRLFSIAREN